MFRRFPAPEWVAVSADIVPLAKVKDWSAEETTDPIYADDRMFFKIEKWSKDGNHIAQLIHAGNRIDKAHAIYDATVKHRPGGLYTLRQGIRVLRKWPDTDW